MNHLAQAYPDKWQVMLEDSGNPFPEERLHWSAGAGQLFSPTSTKLGSSGLLAVQAAARAEPASAPTIARPEVCSHGTVAASPRPNATEGLRRGSHTAAETAAGHREAEQPHGRAALPGAVRKRAVQPCSSPAYFTPLAARSGARGAAQDLQSTQETPEGSETWGRVEAEAEPAGHPCWPREGRASAAESEPELTASHRNHRRSKGHRSPPGLAALTPSHRSAFPGSSRWQSGRCRQRSAASGSDGSEPGRGGRAGLLQQRKGSSHVTRAEDWSHLIHEGPPAREDLLALHHPAQLSREVSDLYLRENYESSSEDGARPSQQKTHHHFCSRTFCFWRCPQGMRMRTWEAHQYFACCHGTALELAHAWPPADAQRGSYTSSCTGSHTGLGLPEGSWLSQHSHGPGARCPAQAGRTRERSARGSWQRSLSSPTTIATLEWKRLCPVSSGSRPI